MRVCCTWLALVALWLTCASHVAAQRKTGGAAHAQSDAHAKKRGANARGKSRTTAAPAAAAKPEAKAPSTASAGDKPASEKSASEKAASDKGADKGHTAAAPSAGAAPDADVQASDDVRTEGDTQVKMMEFGGLDIEGQLKTPQMLYFLNRLRAEFGHPRLPHRSFMPELEQSTKGKAF
jgi:hypothetical protein